MKIFKGMFFILFFLLSACSNISKEDIKINNIEYMKKKYNAEGFTYNGNGISHEVKLDYIKKLDAFLKNEIDNSSENERNVLTKLFLKHIGSIDGYYNPNKCSDELCFTASSYSYHIKNLEAKNKIIYIIENKPSASYEIKEEIINIINYRKSFVKNNILEFNYADICENEINRCNGTKNTIHYMNEKNKNQIDIINKNIDSLKEILVLSDKYIEKIESTKQKNSSKATYTEVDKLNGDMIALNFSQYVSEDIKITLFNLVNTDYDLIKIDKNQIITFEFPPFIIDYKSKYDVIITNENGYDLTLNNIEVYKSDDGEYSLAMTLSMSWINKIYKVLSTTESINIKIRNLEKNIIDYSTSFEFENKIYIKSFSDLIDFRLGSMKWRNVFYDKFNVDVSGSLCAKDLQKAVINSRVSENLNYQILDCGEMRMLQALPDKAIFTNYLKSNFMPIILKSSGTIKGQGINSRNSIFKYTGLTYYNSIDGSSIQALNILPIDLTENAH